jgi:hypothetical protein
MDDNNLQDIESEIIKLIPSEQKRVTEAFFLSAMSSIPWVGGFLTAMSQLYLDKDQIKKDTLQVKWMQEHKKKLDLLKETMQNIENRFELLGEKINERINSEEYLQLVRKSFRVWDNADTDEKRKYVSNLITNASSTSLTSDDVIRLFIDWLNNYHEIHFSVIREIYNKPSSTRYTIWKSINTDFPREDSADADLYKMIIRDLSTGGVIRQTRNTTTNGEFFKRKSTHLSSSKLMESAFDKEKTYELTELGKQFVHYVIVDIVPRIE